MFKYFFIDVYLFFLENLFSFVKSIWR